MLLWRRSAIAHEERRERVTVQQAMRAVLGELGRTLQNRLIIDDLPTPPFPMMITLISAADAQEWFVR